MNQPRISVNKLGEYLTANPVRRRSIIKSQKEPSPAVVPLYQKALPILERFFVSGDLNLMHKDIEKLRTKEPKSEWDGDDNSNTALALEMFTKFHAQLDLSDCSIHKADPQEQSKLGIGGVDVSVRPDFYLRFEKRRQAFIGALKFHWTKSDDHQLTQEGGIYVAATLHHFLEHFHANNLKPSLEHCFSIDVFRQAIRTAPKGYQRIRNNIIAGCEEIALRWNGA